MAELFEQSSARPASNQQTLDYDWLLNKVAGVVFEEESLPYNFFRAQIDRSDIAFDMSEQEWLWLQYNCDFLKRLMANLLPASMIYVVHKTSWSSFHTRDFSRMTGQSEQKVNRWANLLALKNLLKKHVPQSDKRVFYVADHSIPNINRLVTDLILLKYTQLDMQKYLQKTAEKVRISQSRKKALREYRRKYWKTHRC